jgi:hypothetical protein
VARQHVNGTVVVDLNHSHETLFTSTFGDWFRLNLAKTIEDAICRTTCLIRVSRTIRVPGYHRARRAS